MNYYAFHKAVMPDRALLLQMIRVMRITAFLILVTLVQVTASTFAQRITMKQKDAALKDVFEQIKRQTGYSVVCKSEQLRKSRPIQANFVNQDVEEVLAQILPAQNLDFVLNGRTFVIKSKVPETVTGLSSAIGHELRLEVSGKVTDEKGQFLPGVTVKVKGSPIGTVTNANGLYSLKISGKNEILIFSFIGYLSQEIAVNDKQQIDVILQEQQSSLNEVEVVIGYGTQLRKDITSAISRVKGKDIENVPVASAVALLQGRAAGVHIVQNTGAPGSTNFTIRVRGTTSINASNNPLYVIDGLPFEGGTSDVNPNDIESMEVLKDAAAAAIYGARAANGVVLITTKRGKTGVTNINLNYYTSLQKVDQARLPQLLDADQFRELMSDQRANGTGITSLYAFIYPEAGISGSSNTNWLKAILRNGKMDNYDLSISGGENKLKFYLSGNYVNQKGVLVHSDYQRKIGQLNLDYQASNKFKIGLSSTFTTATTNSIDGENGPFQAALFKSPTMPVYNPDGTYFLEDISTTINPVSLAMQKQNITKRSRLVANIFGEYTILEGLVLRANWGTDIANTTGNIFTPSTALRNGVASGSTSYSGDNNWINENTLTYKKTWNRHRLTALVGYSQLENSSESSSATGIGYASNNIPTLNAAATPTEVSSLKYANGLSSLFSRLGYIYDDKYYVEGSIRRDGSSKFGSNNRYGTFHALSLGWQVVRESFFEGITNVINDLKLRASYGRTGNQGGIGNYISQGGYSSGFGYVGQNGISPTSIPNPDLKWETTDSYNLGADFSFLSSRITLSTDIYLKKTSNLLLNVNLPSTSSFSSVLKNVGNTQNKGLEITLNTVNIKSDHFNWNTGFNISFNQNKIIKLYQGEDIIASLGAAEYGKAQAQYILREGQAIGSFYGWESKGVYANSTDNTKGIRYSNATGYLYRGGDEIFVDQNGDNLITDADRVIIGSALPIFTGGFSNEFSYKRLSLSILAQFSYGNDLFNGTKAVLESMSLFQNSDLNVLNRWRAEGDITNVPRADHNDPGINKRPSTRWIEDGTYLRIKTATLSYDLSELGKRMKLSKLRIYATAQNLFTLTNYTGIDPESSFSNSNNLGFDYATYPQYRTFLLGVNVGF